MKTRLLILMIVIASVCPLVAGPSTGRQSFLESSRRQDFTGQGTYHRLGLFREQRNATKAAEIKPGPSSEPKRNLWQSFLRLFQNKSNL